MWAAAPLAMGWGVGHRDIAQQVFDHLPTDITNDIPADVRAKAIHDYALYPDSSGSLLPEDIGQPAVDLLKATV